MIILRVDFSKNIGVGHLKRALLFIEKYKRKRVIIVCKECVKELISIPFIKIKNEKEFFEIVKKLTPKEVIVDNYNFDFEDEKEFKKLFPKIKLICFDDLYDNHFCDQIINHNLYANKEKYKNPSIVKIIPPLIREEFKNIKKQKREDFLLISLGGSDSKNLSLKILKSIKQKRINTHLFTTTANSNLKELQKFVFLNKWVKLHINKDLAPFMAKAKFAIITPSVISYEAIYMKLKFLAIQTAENQKYIAKYLKSKGYKILNEREIKKISNFISL